MIALRFTVQNEEHSKQIQDEIFSLGGGWGIGSPTQEYQHTDKPYLLIESCQLFENEHITDNKFLSLMYGNTVKDEQNLADDLPAHIARRIPSDLSITHDVTLENYKSFFNKISFKSQYEKILANSN